MAFASKCARATGVDATLELLSRARAEASRRSLRNVDFEQGDAGALHFADGLFDVVSCRAAFHHFDDPGHVLAEMIRVAAPGGRLLVADMLTSEDPVQAVYHNRIERLCDPSHVRALPASELQQMFRDAGLRVLRGGERSLDFDLEEWMAHGGPSPEVAREIVSLVEASLDVDRSGLSIRRENGRLTFSLRGGAFVLAKP
jgi:SAM-dependent methyltransferase